MTSKWTTGWPMLSPSLEYLRERPPHAERRPAPDDHAGAAAAIGLEVDHHLLLDAVQERQQPDEREEHRDRDRPGRTVRADEAESLLGALDEVVALAHQRRNEVAHRVLHRLLGPYGPVPLVGEE